MRLDRMLANTAHGSRSEVKKIIRSGRIRINGNIVRDEGCQVNPAADRVHLDDQLIRYREYLYLMLNKPAGVITATEDRSEQTVLDLIDPKYRHKGLYPVGRLDKDTEGLLLLTNDGDLGHRLLSPKKHVPKRYFVILDKAVEPGDLQAFREGICLEDGYVTLPAELEMANPENSKEVFVIIHEGKFHQIKRMFEALGKKVVYLKRVAMGELHLDPDLPVGAYRELTEDELRCITH